MAEEQSGRLLKLKEGDEIEIRITGEREFAVRHDQSKNKALARLRRVRSWSSQEREEAASAAGLLES